MSATLPQGNFSEVEEVVESYQVAKRNKRRKRAGGGDTTYFIAHSSLKSLKKM